MGFILGSAGGGLLGMFIGDYLPSGGGIAGMIATAIFGVIVGAVIGSMLGVWGLLRACEYSVAGSTALWTGVGWIPIGVLMIPMAEVMGDTALLVLPIVASGVCCGARRMALAARS
jgi:hypothetical protein